MADFNRITSGGSKLTQFVSPSHSNIFVSECFWLHGVWCLCNLHLHSSVQNQKFHDFDSAGAGEGDQMLHLEPRPLWHCLCTTTSIQSAAAMFLFHQLQLHRSLMSTSNCSTEMTSPLWLNRPAHLITPSAASILTLLTAPSIYLLEKHLQITLIACRQSAR